MNMNLSVLLNATQKEAVEYNEGPSVVVAGAGSGKTRVLTYKIAYLLERGVSPSSVLALTFTNKAAREMKERIASVVGEKVVKYLWMGTFHSMFLKILRMEVGAIGYQPNFTIYDTADSRALVKAIVKDLNLDVKLYTPKSIQGRISNLKNHFVSPMQYANSSESVMADRRANVPDFAQVYDVYCTRCRQANAMDFDDILIYTNALFEQRKDVLERYQDRFQYLLVDEYQDTNTVQHRIVTKLAEKHGRICVVGDDAQSIYSFRGAQIDNMLRFKDLFSGCRLFKLEENYRSTQMIVGAANSLIAKNKHQIRKTVFSNRGVGEKIDVVRAYSDYDEAARVAAQLAEVHELGEMEWKDMAVLYRNNAQSRVLEDAMRKAEVPYKIYGGLSFYQRKEIKDMLAYLRLIVNPNDVESLKRVINYPTRGIGDTTLQKLLLHQRNSGLSMMAVMENPLGVGLPVNKGTAAKLVGFADVMKDVKRAVEEEGDAYSVAKYVYVKSGVLADVSSKADPDNEVRKENLDEFMGAVKEFCDKRMEESGGGVGLEDFLSEVSLLTDMDNEEGDKLDSVTLMTVHASKGLEFGLVCVVGMEENLFPSARVDDVQSLEEERRLFYVAITRAKEKCVVSYTESRFMHGQTQFPDPSRFLSDIDQQYLSAAVVKRQTGGQAIVNPFGGGVSSSRAEYGRAAYAPNRTPKVAPVVEPRRNLKRINPSEESVSGVVQMVEVGQVVKHQLFGVGEVKELEGEGANTKATIEFETHGEKQLLLKYARLEVN